MTQYNILLNIYLNKFAQTLLNERHSNSLTTVQTSDSRSKMYFRMSADDKETLNLQPNHCLEHLIFFNFVCISEFRLSSPKLCEFVFHTLLFHHHPLRSFYMARPDLQQVAIRVMIFSSLTLYAF
jgi:hypothetical protein